MSQGPSSHSDDDEISLAVQFQGLNITIQGQGPASRALDFVHKLSPGSSAARTAPTSVQASLLSALISTRSQFLFS